ncbi:hypothetical protein ACLOJK_007856 [Asimina triloba]
MEIQQQLGETISKIRQCPNQKSMGHNQKYHRNWPTQNLTDGISFVCHVIQQENPNVAMTRGVIFKPPAGGPASSIIDGRWATKISNQQLAWSSRQQQI